MHDLLRIVEAFGPVGAMAIVMVFLFVRSGLIGKQGAGDKSMVRGALNSEAIQHIERQVGDTATVADRIEERVIHLEDGHFGATAQDSEGRLKWMVQESTVDAIVETARNTETIVAKLDELIAVMRAHR